MIRGPKKSCLIYLGILSLTLYYVSYRYYYMNFKYYRVDLQDLKSMAQIIDILNYNLEYVHNNVTICEPRGKTYSTRTRLLINVIVSARGNFKMRQVLRNTWGSRRNYIGNVNGEIWLFRSVFILGSASPTKWGESVEDKQLDEEISMNGDIIMGRFIDTYRNLTTKHLFSYKWLLDHCPLADAVLKNDDDVFVNVPAIVKFLSDNLSEGSINCMKYHGAEPRRDGGKWNVLREEYPFDIYPDYCAGAGYLTTIDVVKRLFDVRYEFRTMPIEDLFVTGILRTHPAVSGHVQLLNEGNRYVYHTTEIEKNWDDNLWFIIIHGESNLRDLKFKRLWNIVNNANESNAK